MHTRIESLRKWLDQFKGTTLSDVATSETRGKTGVVLIALLFSALDGEFWPNPRAPLAVSILILLLFCKELVHLFYLIISKVFFNKFG